MLIKRLLIIILIIFLSLTVLELLDLPLSGLNEDSFGESDYASQIQEKFKIAEESFFVIKTSTGFQEAFLFLQGQKKKNILNVVLYDKSGREVLSLGKISDKVNKKYYDLAKTPDISEKYEIKNGIFHYNAILKAHKSCMICHRNTKKGEVMGILAFSDELDGKVFYGRERSYIFISIGILLILLLILIIKWDTQKFIKEIFDK